MISVIVISQCMRNRGHLSYSGRDANPLPPVYKSAAVALRELAWFCLYNPEK